MKKSTLAEFPPPNRAEICSDGGKPYLNLLNGAQCVKNYNTTNWSDLRIFMKINQMHSVIHELPKSIVLQGSTVHINAKK